MHITVNVIVVAAVMVRAAINGIVLMFVFCFCSGSVPAGGFSSGCSGCSSGFSPWGVSVGVCGHGGVCVAGGVLLGGEVAPMNPSG